MSLAAQWDRIEADLPEGWGNARLVLTPEDGGRLPRTAALLGPLMPGRTARELRFFAARRGAGPSPAAVRRALERLDEEKIAGELRLVAAGEPEPAALQAAAPTLAAAWDAALAALPADWSDVYGEVELTSTDHLEPAALALGPVNPARFGGMPGFRFRCARQFGYGASPGMVRRCLARLDERGMPGQVRILRALSDTRPVLTQGPVWYVGGKAV